MNQYSSRKTLQISAQSQLVHCLELLEKTCGLDLFNNFIDCVENGLMSLKGDSSDQAGIRLVFKRGGHLYINVLPLEENFLIGCQVTLDLYSVSVEEIEQLSAVINDWQPLLDYQDGVLEDTQMADNLYTQTKAWLSLLSEYLKNLKQNELLGKTPVQVARHSFLICPSHMSLLNEYFLFEKLCEHHQKYKSGTELFLVEHSLSSGHFIFASTEDWVENDYDGTKYPFRKLLIYVDPAVSQSRPQFPLMALSSATSALTNTFKTLEQFLYSTFNP